MYLKSLEINGFKSFAKKSVLNFNSPISSIVGPNGSGKSNVAEAFRFVLGEQSFKSMRGKRGEDLIFGGTSSTPKQGRASVKVIFDNASKKLPVDFDEVILERVVHRDGVNEYLINNSPVRLKDIHELLASANIGSSGHHIISQGEADKILNASIKERRQILEEALGLRVFQFKKAESEKKLVKTEENTKQIESLRREIAPHIKFLKKQVEKIEAGKKLREELTEFYKTYLKIESLYLAAEKNRVEKEIKEPKLRLENIDKEIAALEEETKNAVNNELVEEIKTGEQKLSQILNEKSDLIRKIGQSEGQLQSLENLKRKIAATEESVAVTLSKEDLAELKNKTKSLEENLNNFESLKNVVSAVIELVRRVTKSSDNSSNKNEMYDDEISKTKKELTEAESLIKKIEERELETNQTITELRNRLEEDKSSSLEAEKKIIMLMSEKNELQKKVSAFAIAADIFERDNESYKQEMVEAAALVGREALHYDELELPAEILDEVSAPENLASRREYQLDRRKKLERMKIKLEEFGAGTGEDTLKEYEEVTERESFLISEIADLEKSADALRQLILELENQIEIKFKEGLEKINSEFNKFFELMFGGGSAGLKLAKIAARRRKDAEILSSDMDEIPEEDQEAEEGVDIAVNLPRKKIKDLMMLSGGERALTSIALLFAISQVNPPPFIILDETDAALDEANSRKYGDMIESLSKYSQLILITHNRETMSRAGVLYGITMIQGVSQLLSVAFEEGLQYAK